MGDTTSTAAASAASTSAATANTAAASAAKKKQIGYFVQLGGVAAIAAGTILSLHHVAIAAAFLGGATAFYIGEKIRVAS